MSLFSVRRFNSVVANSLASAGYPAPVARALAARGVCHAQDLNGEIKDLLPPHLMKNCVEAGKLLAQCILEKKKIIIIGDYDCDGASGVAVGILGIRLLGAVFPDFLIPDREKDGYGLSKFLVDRALMEKAEVLLTVDNGISSVEAVKYAKEKGLTVIVTDHHLPADTLPEADFIVNPNQHGDNFPSKALCGAGVMFYLLLATRSALRELGLYSRVPQPNLLTLIDLVALATIADVVPLDRNNRIIVTKGIERIRQNKLQSGLSALLKVAGRNCFDISATELAFSVAPRINAAGRLSTNDLGVYCLISADAPTAFDFAQKLEELNKERKVKEREMQQDALSSIGTLDDPEAPAICLYDPTWHSGIVGLVASRIKDSYYRPTIAFAPSAEEGREGEIKGSGRSINGIHLRDTLDLINKNHPGLILKFGGHSLAAGLTIKENDLPVFEKAFKKAVLKNAPSGTFVKNTLVDGELAPSDFTMSVANAIDNIVWGPSFPEPIFANHFVVKNQKLLKDTHLKLDLEMDGVAVSGIWFRRKKPLPEKAYLAYKICVNQWAGRRTLQLIIEDMEDEEERLL